MVTVIIDGRRIEVDGRVAELIRLSVKHLTGLQADTQLKVEFNCAGSAVSMAVTRYYRSSLKRSEP